MMGDPALDETSHRSRQNLDTAGKKKNREKAHKGVTKPKRRSARQQRLVNPRSVDVESESLRISRRGSGWWRSSSAPGLSTLQFEGSADHENWERGRERK